MVRQPRSVRACLLAGGEEAIRSSERSVLPLKSAQAFGRVDQVSAGEESVFLCHQKRHCQQPNVNHHSLLPPPFSCTAPRVDKPHQPEPHAPHIPPPSEAINMDAPRPFDNVRSTQDFTAISRAYQKPPTSWDCSIMHGILAVGQKAQGFQC